MLRGTLRLGFEAGNACRKQPCLRQRFNTSCRAHTCAEQSVRRNPAVVRNEEGYVMTKRTLFLMIGLVLLFGMASAVAAQEDTAFLMYADAGWTYQYWGEAAEGGVVANNATITGPGDYVVGLDFTGTEAGEAAGLAFTAVGITTGEQTFPGYFIEITSIKINGEEIPFEKGYTSSDDGIVTRMNIYNEWVGELPSDARSYDGDISDAAPVIVDKELFGSLQTVEVAFTLHEGIADLAYLMYADGSWTYQYWGEAAEGGVVATNATILGAGDYTVGLDFTGTEAGEAAGLAFTAVGITTGEQTFPGYFIEITSITINGEEIPFEKGYTSSDDGITTRMNIYNEWVGGLPDDARSYDGDISDAAAVIVDKAPFESVQTIDVAFTLHEGLGDFAYLMYADGSWTYQYWGGDAEGGVSARGATIRGDGSYTVGLDFTGTDAGAATDMAFSAVGITTGELTFPGSFIEITTIRVNGEEIPFEKGYTSSDDGVTTRMNIFNEWVAELPDDARSIDGDISDAAAIIVDKAAFAEVQTVEVDFNFTVGIGAAAAGAVAIDVDAALAAEYNAYFGVQTVSYIFRNAWNDSYGIDTTNWTHLTGWDGPDEVDYGGSFTDAVITGNGEYTVGVELGDMAFGEDEAFNLLFVSTDIPGVLLDEGYITISDVRTSMDAREGREYTYADSEGGYVRILVMNTYDNNVGTETIPFIMPTESIDISFTISGLAQDAEQVAEPVAAQDAEPVAATGLPLWAKIVLIAVGVGLGGLAVWLLMP
jgi:hypothetical protein